MEKQEILKEEIIKNVGKRIRESLDLSREIRDEELHIAIHKMLLEETRGGFFSLKEREGMARRIFNSIRKLDVLQELVEDEEISEIMINGPENIFVEKKGRISKLDKRFESGERLEDIIQQIVAGVNRVVNESSPIVDARLENGSRVNAVLSPPAINGPIITIRRFPDCAITMEELLKLGSITTEAASFLQKAVERGCNIFISGGTGSGKTTFLNVLSGYIPADSRVITIEDSAELQIKGVPNLVRLETRNATGEGCREITMRDLLKSALRMRPDRIVVGEVRGSEAIDMLQAFNTGHDGSLSTGHANSARDMLARLETMVLMGVELPLAAVRRQIASGIDLLVHLARMEDKSRKVVEIHEVLDVEGEEIRLNPLFLRGERKEGRSASELVRINPVQALYKMKGE